MWVCLNNAFVSIVQSKDDPNTMLVRARRVHHLKNCFPDKKIMVTHDSDYKYRVFVTRDEVIDMMVNKIENIDYSNFKNSVVEEDLHDMYNQWWVHHYYLQK